MLFSVLPVMVCFILFAAYWKVQRISIWRNGESKSNYLSENIGVSILWFIVFTLMVHHISISAIPRHYRRFFSLGTKTTQ